MLYKITFTKPLRGILGLPVRCFRGKTLAYEQISAKSVYEASLSLGRRGPLGSVGRTASPQTEDGAGVERTRLGAEPERERRDLVDRAEAPERALGQQRGHGLRCQPAQDRGLDGARGDAVGEHATARQLLTERL